MIRTMLRLATVAALMEKTWAETRVFDSDNTPLEETLKEGDPPKPYVVVYTDNDDRMDVSGTDVFSAKRTINLIIEIAVASKIKAFGADLVEVSTPHTDPGMEMAVDVVELQCLGVLFADPTDEWGEFFKFLVHGSPKVSTKRGGRADAGVRWAARQLIIQCEVICDNPPGIAPDNDHVVHRFLELARADSAPDEFDEAADIVEAMYASSSLPSWQQAQAWLGLTRRGIRSTGIAPLADDDSFIQATETVVSIVDDEGEAPPLVTGTVQDEDEGSSGTEQAP